MFCKRFSQIIPKTEYNFASQVNFPRKNTLFPFYIVNKDFRDDISRKMVYGTDSEIVKSATTYLSEKVNSNQPITNEIGVFLKRILNLVAVDLKVYEEIFALLVKSSDSHHLISKILSQMQDFRVKPNLRILHILIEGSKDDGSRIRYFQNIAKYNYSYTALSYDLLIKGLDNSGKISRRIIEMKKLRLKPLYSTYMKLLSVAPIKVSHQGGGYSLYTAWQELTYNYKPRIDAYHLVFSIIALRKDSAAIIFVNRLLSQMADGSIKRDQLLWKYIFTHLKASRRNYSFVYPFCNKMIEDSVIPDDHILNCLLNSLVNGKDNDLERDQVINKAVEVFNLFPEYNINYTLEVFNGMIQLFSRSDYLNADEANRYFLMIKDYNFEPNEKTFKLMMVVCNRKGDYIKAHEYFMEYSKLHGEKMLQITS